VELSPPSEPNQAVEQSRGVEAEAAVEARPSALDYVGALPRGQQLAIAGASVVLTVLCFLRFGLSGRAVVESLFASVLVLLTAIDIQRRLIPNVIVLPTLAIVLVAQIALAPDRTLEWVIACVGTALFFFVPLLIYPAGMGLGDVKLAALLGAALGKAVATALIAGLLAAAAFGLYILLRDGFSAGRKTAIAYAPFLAFGGLVAVLFGAR
jgi:leader peptidase (prepilin peptidase)/N-methyltransferase